MISFKKKSFVSVVYVACMLVRVGYINYEYNETREKNLGKTVYVSTNQGEIIVAENNEEIINIQNVKENINSIYDILFTKNIEGYVTYLPADNKYYIYLKDTNVNNEDILNLVKEKISVDEDKISINNLK